MKKLIIYTLSAILGIGISYNANATLSFTLNTAFSGDQPDGTVKVDFTSVNLTTVNLTITSGLVGPENMAGLYLNLNPNYNPTSLSFAKTGGTGSFTDPISPISTGTDAFKAGGDGLYDILFNFAPPGYSV